MMYSGSITLHIRYSLGRKSAVMHITKSEEFLERLVMPLDMNSFKPIRVMLPNATIRWSGCLCKP